MLMLVSRVVIRSTVGLGMSDSQGKGQRKSFSKKDKIFTKYLCLNENIT